MPDAPITLAEMVEEAERALDVEGQRLHIFPARVRPQQERRIAIMEEIARYLRREMEPARMTCESGAGRE